MVGRDPAEIVRIVDDRHEEIRRGDDAVVLVKLPHRGVVASLDPYEELSVGTGRRLPGENLLQHGRSELAAAAAAMGEARQLDSLKLHDPVSIELYSGFSILHVAPHSESASFVVPRGSRVPARRVARGGSQSKRQSGCHAKVVRSPGPYIASAKVLCLVCKHSLPLETNAPSRFDGARGRS